VERHGQVSSSFSGGFATERTCLLFLLRYRVRQ